MKQVQERYTPPLFVKKFELDLQERIDTGQMPTCYNYHNMLGTSLVNLNGPTDVSPILISRLIIAFAGERERKKLIKDETKRIETRIKERKELNDDTISNEEIGLIKQEEAIETVARATNIIDERYEKRQTIGLLIAPEDMKGLRTPPVITDLNACEQKIKDMGIPVVQTNKILEDNEDMYDEYINDEEEVED